jgi:orotate phosphoribosyltransferase
LEDEQMNFQTLKQNYIKGLLKTNAFIIKSIDEKPFTLRSGRESYIFLDHARVATSAKAYRAYIDIMAAVLQDMYGEEDFVLCNVDSKISAQMVGSLAYILNKPQIIFKSKALTAVEKGTGKELTGDLDWDRAVAIIDDVATGGDGTAKNVADLVKTNFKHVSNIQIFVGFVREIGKTTYKMNHVVTRTELIQIVWDTLSEGQKQAIEKETNSK